jgi:hypothetical protein
MNRAVSLVTPIGHSLLVSSRPLFTDRHGSQVADCPAPSTSPSPAAEANLKRDSTAPSRFGPWEAPQLLRLRRRRPPSRHQTRRDSWGRFAQGLAAD